MAGEGQTNIPTWIKADLFENVFKDTVPGYKKCNKFNIQPALAPGENYSTLMLKIEAELVLQEECGTKSVSFMLKVCPDNEFMKDYMKHYNTFEAEKTVFTQIKPELEKLYADVGVAVEFGAKSYHLPTNEVCLLLENLKTRDFKNANRIEGLDMEHTQCVLKKLAQMHAASAVRVAQKGHYGQKYDQGHLVDSAKPLLETMFDGIRPIFIRCAKDYTNSEDYIEDFENAYKGLFDGVYRLNKPDPNEFNVLNHGDAWCNNIMFQYDAAGKITETFFVDYQQPRYGSPAQDIIYFILTSVKYDIKIKEFDFFIKYYHDQLVESLKLLKYTKKIPTLREIHKMLLKYGIWGVYTVVCALSLILAEPSDNAKLDNFCAESDEASSFKNEIYSNARFRKHLELILPWLHNRGAMSY